MAQRPIALDLLVCEQIIIDEATRAITPVNCFSQRRVTRVPARPFPFAVLAFLTNGLGEMPLELQIIRMDTDEIVYSRQSTVQFLNPLQETRLRLRLASFSFPAACVYEVLLLIDREVVAHRRVRILVPEVEP